MTGAELKRARSNAARHKKRFGDLPQKIRNALKSAMSKEGKDTLEQLINEVTSPKALSETGEGGQAEG